MILKSKALVVDNCGISKINVFKVLTKKKHTGLIGDFLLVSVFKYRLKKKFLKARIYKAMVINLKTKKLRRDGFTISCYNNNVIIFSRAGDFYGNFINSFFLKETYKKLIFETNKKFLKLFSFVKCWI